MLVSTKTTLVNVLAFQPTRPTSLWISIDFSKQFLKSLGALSAKLFIPRKAPQVFSDKLAHRRIVFSSLTASTSIDFIVNTYGDVLHNLTVTVKLWKIKAASETNGGCEREALINYPIAFLLSICARWSLPL